MLMNIKTIPMWHVFQTYKKALEWSSIVAIWKLQIWIEYNFDGWNFWQNELWYMDGKWWDDLPQVESIFMDDCDRPNNLEISKKNKW